MERLWAPWRMTYIGNIADNDKNCFLCAAAAGDPDDHFVLWKNDLTFCVLNRFPYNNGHLLISPVRHEGCVEALSAEEQAALMRDSIRAQKLLAGVVGAQGFNWGLNVGRCSGAGLVDHLHMHVVPRWEGDTNFMPVFADVKVIPQALEDLHGKLVAALKDRQEDRT